MLALETIQEMQPQMPDYPPVPKLDLSDGAVDQLLNRLAAVQIDLGRLAQSPGDGSTQECARRASAALQAAIDFVRQHANLDPEDRAADET